MKRCLKVIYFKLLYYKKHVKINLKSNIGFNSKFEGYNVVNSKTEFIGYLGYGSYIGSNCNLNAKIGRFCSISNDVATIQATHPTHDFVSTNPIFYSMAKQNGDTYVKKQKFKEVIFVDEKNRYSVIIGNDVWIGNRVLIMGGVTIGDGAIIGAGSIVTKDVNPYSIVGGAPARLIKNRFFNDKIEFLMKFRWWDKDIDWIEANADIFDNIEKFYNKFGVDTGENNYDCIE